MGVKDKLKQLGKIRVDFWNEGKPSSVTVDLPAPPVEKPFVRRRPKVQPVIAQEAKREVLPPPVHQPEAPVLSPAAQRLRAVLDADPPKPIPAPVFFEPPVPADTSYTVPHVDPPYYPEKVTPTAQSLRTVTATCPLCGKTVDAWRTYADGSVRCLPCSFHQRKGIHAV